MHINKKHGDDRSFVITFHKCNVVKNIHRNESLTCITVSLLLFLSVSITLKNLKESRLCKFFPLIHAPVERLSQLYDES